jgi:hypothetical protein
MTARDFLRRLLLGATFCTVASTIGFGQNSTPLSSGTNAGHFVKVFAVADRGYNWSLPAFGCIFIIVGFFIAIFPRIIKTTGIPFLNFKSKLRSFHRYFFLGFGILWTAITFIGTYSQYLRHKSLVQDNKCRVVEGLVQNFVAMPFAGHAQESFSIAGVQFAYSDFVVTDGFNNASSHGGLIKADSYVRICYDPSGNIILRLEIRDFKGDAKDYANAPNIFSDFFHAKPEDIQNLRNQKPPVELPWYSNLFVVLYFLDFAAILALFLPYVRTFFRIKTAIVYDCPVPKTLEAEKRVKLRNSMIYWDVDNHAIWLRPRGFNIFQIPLTVALLRTDPIGESVKEMEIRFSSGFPVVMIVFLWTVYRSMSAVMAIGPNPPPPAIFTGFMAFAVLMFLVSGYFFLRRTRSRMTDLVAYALLELKEMQDSYPRPWALT